MPATPSRRSRGRSAPRRLPLASELVAAKARGVALASPELTGDVRVNDARFGQVVLQADARTVHSAPIDTARRFRCVAAPGDG